MDESESIECDALSRTLAIRVRGMRCDGSRPWDRGALRRYGKLIAVDAHSGDLANEQRAYDAICNAFKDAQSENAMISALVRNGESEKAHALCEAMFERGTADAKTFCILFAMLSHRGEVAREADLAARTRNCALRSICAHDGRRLLCAPRLFRGGDAKDRRLQAQNAKAPLQNVDGAAERRG